LLCRLWTNLLATVETQARVAVGRVSAVIARAVVSGAIVPAVIRVLGYGYGDEGQDEENL
jgi:fucose permease